MTRVALVHDWLTGLRGGERVLEQLCLLHPEAEVFTLLHVKGSAGPVIEARRIHTSFLQHLPAARTRYRQYLPLFPAAIESLDLRGFELVISTSHAVAKGCRPDASALHVSYVHTPMRYVWDQFDAYFGPGRAGLATRLAARAVAPALRAWDVRSTARAQGLVANSRFVADRIRRYWGREADAVVYPPVDTLRFAAAAGEPRGDFALVVSALVPYKRVDLVVRAFGRAGRRLVVAGGGPELERLRAMAGPSVELLGAVDDAALSRLYAQARFFVLPGEEDFGIAPVEAMSAGRPVLALARGGALETVVDGETGTFFAAPTEESLLAGADALERLLPRLEPERIRAHACQFGVEQFRDRWTRAFDAIRERAPTRAPL